MPGPHSERAPMSTAKRSNEARSGPLEAIRVTDLTTTLLGPYATDARFVAALGCPLLNDHARFARSQRRMGPEWDGFLIAIDRM